MGVQAFRLLVGIFLVIGVFFSSCSLHYWVGGEVYFYDIAGEGNNPSNTNLLSKKNGYTIIMSRGVGEDVLDKGKAEKLSKETEFTLTLDDQKGSGPQDLEGGGIGVDKLGIFGKDGWHVVQSFETGTLPAGNYKLRGTTEGEEGNIRDNTVTLKVK